MSAESLVDFLAGVRTSSSVERVRVLVIPPDGATRIEHLPAVRIDSLYGARWARRALVTPPPHGEIRIAPGVILVWGGGEPNGAASGLFRGELDLGYEVRGEAVVLRYAPGGLLDLGDPEILWVEALLAGYPRVGAP